MTFHRLVPSYLINEFENRDGLSSSDNQFNLQFNSTTAEIVNDLQQKQNLVTSGKEFTGHTIRKFPKNELKFIGKFFSKISERDEKVLLNNRKYLCDKWGVMTTIFYPPSEAVRRFMYRKEWCVVIVGDKGRPTKEVRSFMQNIFS